MLEKLATPQPSTHMTSRLPNLFARKNAALIASLQPSEKAREGMNK
jgi:hypothetical protein